MKREKNNILTTFSKMVEFQLMTSLEINAALKKKGKTSVIFMR